MVILLGIFAALILNEFAAAVVVPAYDPRQHVHFTDADGPGPMPPLAIANTVSRQVKNTGDYNVTVRINRHGLRDDRDIAKATAADYIVVGDSFMFGWGVEEDQRFSEQLEKRIGRPVYNLGITGNLDTYQDLLDYAERLGAKVRNVILCVTMETDIERYDLAKKPPVSRSPVPPPTEAPRPLSALAWTKAWLMQHSSLYFMTTAAIHQSRWLEAAAVAAGLIVPNLEGIHDGGFDAEAVRRSAERVVAYERYNLTVVLIPSRGLWHGKDRADHERTHAAFLAALRARHINVVDLKPAFEKGGAPLQYHFRNDGHWNPRGHALAAKVVAARLLHH